MYYPHHRVIFVAINKTGSTSVLTALNDALYVHDVPEIWQKKPFTKMARVHEHLKHAHAYCYYHLLGADEYSQCLVLSQVRNPWDKTVSDFIFRCRAPQKVDLWRTQRAWFVEHGLLEPTDNPGKDLFKLYVKALQSGAQVPHPHWLQLSEMFDMPDRDRDYTNQIDGLQDPDGNVIVNEIMKLEELPSRWGQVQDSIRARTGKLVCDLPHVNRSKRNEYKWYYDDETYSIIEDLFRRDIAYFDYAF